MCGGGKAPKDNSDKVAAIEQQAAREARVDAAAQEQKKQAEFDARMNAAFGSGITSADDYFTSRGLDPKQYQSDITNKASQIRSSVPNLTGDPGSYFSGLGENVFSSLQEGARGKAMRGVNSVAPSGFATSRIADTSDDATLAAILGEQEATGKGYIDNLKGRGVITDSGYAAALKNLMDQKPGAQGKLTEIGNGILNTGRGGAENIANEGRTRASNLNLGENFDPFAEIGGRLNTFFSDFFNNLGTTIRGQAPTNLFDTSGLANIAGAAQGGQNTPFDPQAVAGIFDKQNVDDDLLQTTNPF